MVWYALIRMRKWDISKQTLEKMTDFDFWSTIFDFLCLLRVSTILNIPFNPSSRLGDSYTRLNKDNPYAYQHVWIKSLNQKPRQYGPLNDDWCKNGAKYFWAFKLRQWFLLWKNEWERGHHKINNIVFAVSIIYQRTKTKKRERHNFNRNHHWLLPSITYRTSLTTINIPRYPLIIGNLPFNCKFPFALRQRSSDIVHEVRLFCIQIGQEMFFFFVFTT